MPLPEDVVADDPRYTSEHPSHHNQIHAAINDLEALAGTLSDVETTTGSQGKVDTHALDSTSVHGISDTAQLPAKNAANTYTADNRFTTVYVKEYPGVDPRHPDFGADPTGVADSAPAINAAIEACMDTPNVLTGHRNGVRPLYLGPGNYKTLSPILFRQANWLKVIGSGQSTRIIPSAAMAQCLLLDKVKYSTFSDFRIEGNGLATAYVIDDVLGLESIATNGQPSSNVHFYNLHILNTKFINGISIGSRSTGGIQCDTSRWYGCCVSGDPGAHTLPWGTHWQAGIKVGNGTPGNNLEHTFFGGFLNGHRYNVYNDNVAGVFLYGMDMNSAEADFLFNSGSTSATGFRSENSVRLLVSTTGAYTAVNFRDFDWTPNNLHTDDRIIDTTSSNGHFLIENMRCIAGLASGRKPAFRTNGNNNEVTIIGCIIPCPVSEVVYSDSGNNPRPRVHIQSYLEIDPVTGSSVKGTGRTAINDNLALPHNASGYARAGVATLVAGAVNVTFYFPTTSYNVLLTAQNSSGTAGELSVTSKVINSHFTITSSSGTDTRDVYWQVVEPA